MSNNWILSRSRFLGLAGTTAAGLMFVPEIFAQSSKKPAIRFGLLSDVNYDDRELSGIRF